LAAAHRAYHLLKADPPILTDTHALRLLEPPLSVVLRVPPLRWLFWRPLMARVGPISAFVVVRSRYAEDGLDAAVAEGCRQYVILGAGLDTWALRHPASDVRVFELDRAGTQAWKAARIRERFGSLPPNLVMVPTDFEHEDVGAALRRGGFDPGAPAFVAWLGVLCYLTEAAISATFRSLAAVSAPGSALTFDTFLPREAMAPEDAALFAILDEGGAQRGEPMRSLLAPEAAAGLLRGAGFAAAERLDAAAIRARYLAGRADGLDVPGFVQLWRARLRL
jgi:methyltransferase (TIGR00027 family)